MGLTDSFLKFFIIDSFFSIKEDVRPLAPKSRLIVLSFFCWVASFIFFVVSLSTAASQKTEITKIKISATMLDGYTCSMISGYSGDQLFGFYRLNPETSVWTEYGGQPFEFGRSWEGSGTRYFTVTYDNKHYNTFEECKSDLAGKSQLNQATITKSDIKSSEGCTYVMKTYDEGEWIEILRMTCPLEGVEGIYVYAECEFDSQTGAPDVWLDDGGEDIVPELEEPCVDQMKESFMTQSDTWPTEIELCKPYENTNNPPFSCQKVETEPTYTPLDAFSLAYANASFFFMLITTVACLGLYVCGAQAQVAPYRVDALHAEIQDLKAKFAALQPQASAVAPAPQPTAET